MAKKYICRYCRADVAICAAAQIVVKSADIATRLASALTIDILGSDTKMEEKIAIELAELEIEIVKTCLVRVRGMLHDADGNQNDMDRRLTEDINIIINRCEESIANQRAIERRTIYISTGNK